MCLAQQSPLELQLKIALTTEDSKPTRTLQKPVKNIVLIQKRHLEMQKLHSEKHLNVPGPLPHWLGLKTHHPCKDSLSKMTYLANYFPEMATQPCQNFQNMI